MPRSFGTDFANAIDDADLDEFRTAVFHFPTAGTKYISDRPVTVGANAHIPLVQAGGWGEIGSAMERFGQSLDVVTTMIVMTNLPHADLGDERIGALLRAETHAVQVEIYENVNVGGTIHQELIFEGVAKGPADRSFQQVRVQVVGLTEKYLNGNACRVITREDFAYANDDAIGATVPWVWGRVPRVRGRAIKGRLWAITADPDNTGDGTLQSVEAHWTRNRRLMAIESITDELFTITFTSASDYSVVSSTDKNLQGTGDSFAQGSGDVDTDFLSVSRRLGIPSSSWLGVPASGDKFYVQMNLGPAQAGQSGDQESTGGIVVVGESHADAPVQEIRAVRWNGHVVLGTPFGTDPGAEDVEFRIDSSGFGGGVDSEQGSFGGTFQARQPFGRESGVHGNEVDYVSQPFTVPTSLVNPRVRMVQYYGVNKIGTPVAPPVMHLLAVDDNIPPTNLDEATVLNDFGMHIYRESSMKDALEDDPTPENGQVLQFPTADTPVVSGRTYRALLSVAQYERGSTASDYYTINVRDNDGTASPGLGTPRIRTNSAMSNLGGYIGFNVIYAGDQGSESLLEPDVLKGEFFVPVVVDKAFLCESVTIRFARYGAETPTGPIEIELMRAGGFGPDGAVSLARMTMSAAEINDAIDNNDGDKTQYWDEQDTTHPYNSPSDTPGPIFLTPGRYLVRIAGEAMPSTDPSVASPSGFSLFGSGTGLPAIDPDTGRRNFSAGAFAPSRGSFNSVQTAAQGPVMPQVTLNAVWIDTDTVYDDGTGNDVAVVKFGCPIPEGTLIDVDMRGSYPESGNHPNRVIKFMHERADVPDARLDLLDDDEASYGTTYRFNGVLEEPGMSWKQAILRAAFECRSAYTWPRDKPMLHFLPSSGGTADMTFGFDDVSVRGKVPEMTVTTTSVEDTVNSLDVRWARDWTQGRGLDAYAEATHVENASAISANGIREKPDLFQFDYVRSSAMASALGAYYIARYALPKDIATHDTKLPALGVERVDQIAYGADVDIVDAADRFLVTGWKLKAPGEGKTRVELQAEELP